MLWMILAISLVSFSIQSLSFKVNQANWAASIPPCIDNQCNLRFLKKLDAQLDDVLKNPDVERTFHSAYKDIKQLQKDILEQGQGPIIMGDDPYFINCMWGEDMQQSVALSALNLKISQYIDYNAQSFDPWIDKKLALLLEAKEFIVTVSNRLPDILDDDEVDQSISTALLLSVFSESLLQAEARTKISSAKERRASFYHTIDACRTRLVDPDPLEMLVTTLSRRCRSSCSSEPSLDSQPTDMDIIVGPPGASLVSDLLLAHCLLALGCCTKLTFHCPSIPVGLTGSTALDVVGHIEHLADPTKGNDQWSVRHLGEAMRLHVTAGRIQFSDDIFWAMGHVALWEMPSHIQDRLRDSKMVFVKGDANFRRLLGEREWPMDTPAAQILSYWGRVPVCALRPVQSEMACGVSEAMQHRLEALDTRWMTRGAFGAVYYRDSDAAA